MLKDLCRRSDQVGMERTLKPCHCYVHGLEGDLIENSSGSSELALTTLGPLGLITVFNVYLSASETYIFPRLRLQHGRREHGKGAMTSFSRAAIVV